MSRASCVVVVDVLMEARQICLSLFLRGVALASSRNLLTAGSSNADQASQDAMTTSRLDDREGWRFRRAIFGIGVSP